MRIVADENLNAQFVKDLRSNGYDVVSIREKYSGISDTEVANLAFLSDCLLITEDKDFGELMFAHKISKITIVFLRYQKEELDIIRKQLLDVIQMYLGKEGHFYITIARGRARITEL